MPHRHFSLLLILLCTTLSVKTQYFYKLDDDFKFNGLNLTRFHNDDPLKGCTKLEHSGFGDIYKPAKDELKTKGFTLKNIRYYTDLHDLPYVWLITAIATDGMISENIITGDMAYGAKEKTSGTYHDITWQGYEQQLRTIDIFLRKPQSDTCYVIIATKITTDRLGEFPSTNLLDWIVK
jgi:hypothetical protein